jgi:hypothetical protein
MNPFKKKLSIVGMSTKMIENNIEEFEHLSIVLCGKFNNGISEINETAVDKWLPYTDPNSNFGFIHIVKCTARNLNYNITYRELQIMLDKINLEKERKDLLLPPKIFSISNFDEIENPIML